MLGQEVLNSDLLVEHFAVYPYSSNIELMDGSPSPMLSYLSQLAVDAACMAWRDHPEATIIMPGETLYGPNLPNTTDLMIERAKEWGVDEDNLVGLYRLPNGRSLNNTYLQTEALRNYVEGKRGIVISSALNFHLPRVQMAAEAYKYGSLFTSPEEIYAINEEELDEDNMALINTQETSGVLSERNLRFLAKHLDKKGRLLTLFAGKNFGRVIDVVDDNGTMILERDFSKRRYKEIQLEMVDLAA